MLIVPSSQLFYYNFIYCSSLNLFRVAGGKLVDMSPEMEKNLKDELDKLAKQYGSVGTDFTKFPTFTFKGRIF